MPDAPLVFRSGSDATHDPATGTSTQPSLAGTDGRTVDLIQGGREWLAGGAR